MKYDKISWGTRIKYIREDNLMLSTKIYGNETQMVRVIIDTDQMIYQLVDPVTGIVFKQSPDDIKITNLEVLQRHAKKGLMSYLKISFDKEKRKVSHE